MRPYYDDGRGIVIYHGDCREVLPGLVAVVDEEAGSIRAADVLVTDPPYGISYESGWGGRIKQGVVGDESTAVRDEALRLWGDRPALVFGKWSIPRPAGVRALLVWDKGMGTGMGDLSIPWKPNHEEIYVFGKGWQGRRDSGILRHNGPNGYAQILGDCTHPNGKPLPLMISLVSKCPPGVVLDAFMGSGTTLLAAKSIGRRAIGIEIEERYCEIAARRLSQEVLAL